MTGGTSGRRTVRRAAVCAFAVLTLGIAALPGTAGASHTWGGYHWARTSNPFTLKLGDNVSGPWDSVLRTTGTDWSASSVLDTTVVAGSANPKNCRPTAGRVQVCNAKYGSNGWLGIAQIWITGGTHISQGTVKLNDTYFATPAYNTTAWRNLVSCQEVGHTLGLDHQDEAFDNANLGTCMDYTSDPSTNQHPNAHDYEQLEAIYGHADSGTTVASSTTSGSGAHEQSEWGQEVARSSDHRTARYERALGGGAKVVTFVIWA